MTEPFRRTFASLASVCDDRLRSRYRLSRKRLLGFEQVAVSGLAVELGELAPQRGALEVGRLTSGQQRWGFGRFA